MSQSKTIFSMRRTGGALTFVFVTLLISGFLRLGGDEFAWAQEIAALSVGSDTPVAKQKPVPTACVANGNTAQMLTAIRYRQAQLDIRDSRSVDRLQALKVAELKIKQNTKALVAAEKRLAATLAIADSAAEKDLLRLTTVYENMKPKNAIGLFGEMAPEFAAGFLGRMRPQSAALIMSSLSPEKAYQISLILAGRNARAPVK
ncbi:MAG: hypothetical protein GXP05_11845 [Alphaproteobacteria bacterium]|nr:hypothetical protein [Alphaproteobacteria bacterium]